MIQLIMFILFCLYLIMLQRVFNVWLKLYQQDSSISVEEKQLSWIILILGAIFWPIVVPISYLTLLERKLAHQPGNLEEDEAKAADYPSDKKLPIVLDGVKC